MHCKGKATDKIQSRNVLHKINSTQIQVQTNVPHNFMGQIRDGQVFISLIFIDFNNWGIQQQKGYSRHVILYC